MAETRDEHLSDVEQFLDEHYPACNEKCNDEGHYLKGEPPEDDPAAVIDY